jgi:hypothetical protein
MLGFQFLPLVGRASRRKMSNGAGDGAESWSPAVKVLMAQTRLGRIRRSEQ